MNNFNCNAKPIRMKRFLILFLILFPGLFSFAQPVKIMLITGGHAFDTIQFFQLFDALEGIEYEHFQQPKANEKLVKDLAKDFDVLVFYDMWNDISETQKKAYVKLTKAGKPFLFLHHSLVSYQNWHLFEKIIGGKYIEKNPAVPENEQSTYEHDVWVYMQPVKNHPGNQRFSACCCLMKFMEMYEFRMMLFRFLQTHHPKSSRIIGWENNFNSSKIIYLQPGHDYRSFESEDYRKLVLQTINYLAEKVNRKII